MAALYEPDGDAFVPTAYTRGPWSPDHQHAGPPSALLARAVERAAGIRDGQTVRLALDILRPVPLDALRVAVRVLRPGRRVEQLEATLTLAADGTELMRARAWRMRAQALDLPGPPPAPHRPPPGPDACRPGARPSFWNDDVAYYDALEWRFAFGDFEEPGPAACWTRMKVDLVAGEPATPFEHLLVMGDAASGVSAMLDWARWTFANVDFDVALERPPAGEWVAMDAITRPGETGAGICSSVLSDARGRVGSSTQALLFAAR
ncbi:MAG: thioesterase family protein [Solirubrobacteraceae bacterium]